MEMDGLTWNILPDHIVVDILTYLPKSDRFNVSLTCKAWNDAMNSVHLWKNFTFRLQEPDDVKQLKCVDRFGSYLRNIVIELDQSVLENRQAACSLIERLANVEERRLQGLTIRFTGVNPCMYAGKEFLDSLCQLFQPPSEDVKIISTLKEVDLSGLQTNLDGRLLDLLSANNPDLKKVNIQNKVIICKIPPDDVLKLIHRCKKLEELRVFSCSCDESVLLALAEEDREPLQHLSIFCRFEQKYLKDLSSPIWSTLVKKLPNLKVTLGFDHTCPLMNISEVMKPEMPVSVLRLETGTDLHNEIRQACRYYQKTLEKLIVQSPPNNYVNLHYLDDALLEIIKYCPLLKSLHVFCVLEKDTVDKILAASDYMRENKTYTLKYTTEPHPWIPGNDFW
jgi:hypothetical protein